jgi:ankyrin repeat protein
MLAITYTYMKITEKGSRIGHTNKIIKLNFQLFLTRDIVELLLSYEASCNSADEKGSSPLHLASWAGKSEIVKTLLTHGPSIANVNLTVSDNFLDLFCVTCISLIIRYLGGTILVLL